MATYGDTLLAELSIAKAQLLKLSHVDYQASEIRGVISAVGAKVEIFLKSAALPGKNPKNNFKWFIDQLEVVLVDEPSRDKLHLLRDKYNDAKHDPAHVIGLLDAIGIIEEASKVVKQIVLSGVGSVGAAVSLNPKRVFWVAVWDHYIHGDSEVHIILPGESEHWLGSPTFDIIYVELAAWDDIKAALVLAGSFKSGEGVIPDSQYQAFCSDPDFLGAWVYEGEYRSLITILVANELRQNLLIGLNRHDSRESMILAYLMASVDVVGNLTVPENLASTIQQRVVAAYAVPPEYSHSQYLAESMADMFLTIDHKEWPRISGPSWVCELKYEKVIPECRVKHANYEIVIDEEYIVRMLWRYD